MTENFGKTSCEFYTRDVHRRTSDFLFVACVKNSITGTEGDKQAVVVPHEWSALFTLSVPGAITC